MIDPHNIPAGKMSKRYLEEWVLFGICVANKPAQITAEKLDKFLKGVDGDTPFAKVRRLIRWQTLDNRLRQHRMGQYNRIAKAFRAAVGLDLNNLTLASLEAIPGIGPKTARMLMLYYNPEIECAPLDTHVLKFLRAEGYKAPQNTPAAGRLYRELEQAFIAEARKRNLSAIELDTQVWQQYAVR